jgi:hypothetical protein
MTRCLALLATLLVATAASAQDEGSVLDRIEVTGSRISYDDLVDTPAVSITRPGDYLLQPILLTNDSRAENDRRRELQQTVAQLVEAGGGQISVLYGDDYRVTLTRNASDIELAKGDRPDTSTVALSLRAELKGDPGAAAALAERLRDFARKAAMSGRTQVELVGGTAIGMNRPERFRYDIVAAISKDTAEVTKALALDCRISLDGLNNRIEWERVSAGELLLFIRYSMVVDDCRMRAAATAGG